MSSPAPASVLSGHNSRINNLKGGAKQAQELRRKRAEQSIELRKQARDEQLQKRRALDVRDEPTSPSGDLDDSFDSPASPQTLPSLQEMIETMNGDTRTKQLYGTKCIRKVLSNEKNPPIDAVIKSGCVPRLIQLLVCEDCPDLQFEAAWALTNIASGTTEHTTSVIQYGAINYLAKLVSSPHSRVSEQAIWALGNIAGEGSWARDKVLAANILQPLLGSIDLCNPSNSLTRTAVWALSNLCRNKAPPVDFDTIKSALPTLCRLLQCNDADVLADTCWALSYLTDGSNDRIGAVQDAINLQFLVPLLAHPVNNVQTAAMRVIGNMVTGTDKQTDNIIEAGFLPMLTILLQSERLALVKEAAWASSNILAGTERQIQDYIDAKLLPHLTKVLSISDARCQREAAWAITHMILEGTTAQISSLMEVGGLTPFLSLLDSRDVRTVMVVLDGLLQLLKKADAFGQLNQLCLLVEEEGHLDKLEKLQNHENEDIYKKTISIIEKYFSEEEETQPDIAPQETNGEFQFNGGSGHIGSF